MERVWTAFLLMFLGASAFAWIVALLHEWDVRPLRRLVAVLRHQAWEACLIAAVTVGFVHHGATKGTNGMDRGDSPVAEGGLSVEGGGMVESDGLRGGQSLSEVPCAAYGGTNDYSTVTDFRITEMHTATNGVMISAAWPTNWSLPLSSLLLYARGDLSTGCWANVASATVPDGCSAVDIGVPCEILPDGGTDRAFLALGTLHDEDGDGLADSDETFIYGTNPSSADTDGDGITDGDEVAMGTNPLSADTDGDGLADYREIGGIVVEPNYATFLYGWVETNLTEAILSDSNCCVTVEMPYPMPLLNETFTHLSVDLNGIVYLRKANDLYPIPLRPYCKDMLTATFPTNAVATAAYWSRLSLSDNEPASSIVVKKYSTLRWVEFSNMRLADSPSPEDNIVSFQVIVPNQESQFLSIIYETSGTYADGRLASVGTCSRNGEFRKSFCHCTSGMIHGGMELYIDPGYGTDPLNPDTDGDGLSDLEELIVGTSPNRIDSDCDGMPDGWEVSNGLDPLSSSGDNGAAGDLDEDGLSNIDEYLNDCNPQDPDTDGDGVSDLAEVTGGSNPSDAGDDGIPPATNLFRALTFNIDGDYAAWEMTIEGIGPLDTRIRRISMGRPNAPQNVTFRMRKSNKYRLSMRWLNSDGHNNPDWYCWQAKVDGLPVETTYNSYSTERKPGVAEIIRGNGWVADNADGLLSGHVHQRQGHGGNVAGHLTATLYVLDVDVSICAPSEAAWTELEASRVILDSEQLRIKTEIKPWLQSMDECRRLLGDELVVRTAGTCPDGVGISLAENATFENLSDRSVLKVWRTRSQLKALGLLPQDDNDDVDEMVWLDMGSADPTQPSNLTDSEAFSALGYEFRGKATNDGTKTLESTPPNSVPSESFFKAAGCEVVSAEYCGFTSSKRQIMNQADIFYYSGHGSFVDEALQSSSDPISYGFLPSMTIGKWHKDLECVVFAGCSILNIGDFRSKSFVKWKTKAKYWFRKKQSQNGGNPGLAWENVGPKYLLGYCWTAPLDSEGAPEIATAFVNNLKSNMAKIDAWRNANNGASALNACAIDTSSVPHKFWYWDETSGVPVWTNAVKGATSW